MWFGLYEMLTSYCPGQYLRNLYGDASLWECTSVALPTWNRNASDAASPSWKLPAGDRAEPQTNDRTDVSNILGTV